MTYLWIGSDATRRPVAGYSRISFVENVAEAASLAAAGGIGALVVQTGAPGEGIDRQSASELLEQAASLPPVWVVDTEAGPAGAVRWIRAGAAQVFSSVDELTRALGEVRPVENTAAGAAAGGRGRGFIGAGPVFAAVTASIASVAARRCNVLIEGETGTGKEVVAREIHQAGPRAKGPFVAVNCAAIPDTLLEAELFGHSKGAFTGALNSRMGKFEAANHGTIFLDEIGDMPLAIQAKLLRVLQEREVERLGGNEKIRLDVRIIAATNLDLAAGVRQGLFRQDLYYRLNVFAIRIPPLRERTEDIPVLAKHLVEKICQAEGIPVKTLEAAAVRKLEEHDWPGNVRELENLIETAIIRAEWSPVISARDFEFQRAGMVASAPAGCMPAVELPAGGMDYQKAVEEFEHALLTQALTRTRGNKTAAAALLGLKRTTLSARMRAIETRLPRVISRNGILEASIA